MTQTTTLPSAADVQARLLRGPYHQWLGLQVASAGDNAGLPQAVLCPCKNSLYLWNR